ncbi:hypothetical protein BD779DRAFT_1668483 [Infundibulicybe gibba]|nr:hypothetical protein BD779DRAFT_1668483 [Infundibulicybe gibba]
MAQPMPTQIVVADQDSQLQYSGTWLLDTSKPQNQIGIPGSLIPASAHKTSQPGSSFTFSFRGSTLGVVGSVFGNSSQAPVWGCSLDGASMTVHGAPAGPASWTFCDATVPNGPHHLMVIVNDPGSVGFWFDYIVYSPSVGVDVQGSHMYRIDRSDPSIVYSSDWNTLGGFANATTSSHSTLSVNFFGTAIDWMGYAPVELSHTPTVASYSIDGGFPVNFSIDGLPSDQTSIYDQELFSIRDLKPGNHTLKVTYLGDQSTAALTLNYFNVLGSDVGGNSTPRSDVDFNRDSFGYSAS